MNGLANTRHTLSCILLFPFQFIWSPIILLFPFNFFIIGPPGLRGALEKAYIPAPREGKKKKVKSKLEPKAEKAKAALKKRINVEQVEEGWAKFLTFCTKSTELKSIKSIRGRKIIAADLWRELNEQKASLRKKNDAETVIIAPKDKDKDKGEDEGEGGEEEEEGEAQGQAKESLEYSRQEVFLREDIVGNVQMRGLKEFFFQTSEDLASCLFHALKCRKTAPTKRNTASSRTHAIVRISVNDRSLPLMTEPGTFYCIDLAGSERASDQSEHNKERQKETRSINKSLMTLKSCLRTRAAVAHGSQSSTHIPYRDSILTHLLKDVFSLEATRVCRTVVVACLAPSVFDFHHTINTLRYAAAIRVGMPKQTMKHRHRC